MKKFIAMLFLIITHNTIYPQNKFSFTFDYAPNNSYRIYRLTDYSSNGSSLISGKNIYNDFTQLSNETEKADFGNSIQIGAFLKLTNKFYLYSGIGYRKLNELLNIKYSVQYTIGSGQTMIYYSYQKYINKIEYLYFPFKLIYNLKTIKKISVQSDLGLGINYLLDENLIKASHGYIYYSKNNELEVKKIPIDMSIGFIFNYIQSNRFSFFIQPDFSMFLTPNVKFKLVDNDFNHCFISQHNYLMELKMGLKINI